MEKDLSYENDNIKLKIESHLSFENIDVEIRKKF